MAARRLGYGLGFLVLTASLVKGQAGGFASNRDPVPVSRPMTSVATASGFQPAGLPVGTQAVSPAGGVPRMPAGGVPQQMPARAELDVMVPSALANHPLALKPEHGPFVICVRSYSKPAWVENGPSALALAEGLANEIRTTQRTPAYVFEHVSEEKKAEFARREAAKREQEPFLRQISELRARAQAQGNEFLEPENGKYTYRFKTVRYNDQFAVIIAGFRTDEDARKALEIVRKWEAPKNVHLLDMGTIHKTTNDKTKGETNQMAQQGYMNPYQQAFVCPNPTVARTATAETSGIDSFTKKLNEDRPYNLLKAKKPWTLAVKQFSAPGSITGAVADKKNLASTSSSGAEVLSAGAEMAEQLARSLRGMRDRTGQARGEEAFVLHTRTGSLVTVGQFDGPDDPMLLETLRRLNAMNFTVSEQQNGVGRPLGPQDKLFSDNILPIPIPR